MTRMRIRLTELGVSQRLSWQEVADIRADHEADLAAAVEQALQDHERFSISAAQAHHFAVCLELLKTAPYPRTGRYYEPRSFAVFEHKPDPDFSCEDDVRDVDPQTVAELPGLAAVA